MDLRKIKDVSKEQQTEAFKKEIFEDIRLFVLKYQRRYYPQYKGELDDLVVDYYTEFTRPKKHRNGETYSEMDRFEYEKLGGKDWSADDAKKLAAHVQRFVFHRLIDDARKDKGEKNYSEKYNEETGELSVDFLAKLASERDPQIEEIEVTPEMILEARDRYDEMDDKKKKEFLELYHEIKETISPNLLPLFRDIVGEDTVESFKKSGKPTGPFADKLFEVLQVPIHTEQYKLQGASALKIEFESGQDAKDMLDYKNLVQEILSKEGLDWYTQKGKYWYFKKN